MLISLLASLLALSILEDAEDVLVTIEITVEVAVATAECSVFEIVVVLPFDFVLVVDTTPVETEVCVFVDSGCVVALSVIVVK